MAIPFDERCEAEGRMVGARRNSYLVPKHG